MHGFGGVPLPLHFEEEYKEFRGRGCWGLYQIRSTKQFTTSSLDKIFNITQFDRITSRTPPVPPPQRLQSSSSYSFIFEYCQHSSSSSSTPLKLLPIALEPPPQTSSTSFTSFPNNLHHRLLLLQNLLHPPLYLLLHLSLLHNNPLPSPLPRPHTTKPCVLDNYRNLHPTSTPTPCPLKPSPTFGSAPTAVPKTIIGAPNARCVATPKTTHKHQTTTTTCGSAPSAVPRISIATITALFAHIFAVPLG
jgi:hypothetical protein